MWDKAVTSLAALQIDMKNAASLVHQTRSNRKGVQKQTMHKEFVNTCKTVADDMEARFGASDHDVMFQGVQALMPGSDTLLEPESVVPFSKLFRVAANESLLTAQLLTARSLLEREKPPVYSLMDLGDYLLSCRAFPLILECIAVAITIPVSSCSAERCFSAVKRILTRLRTSMSDVRLSDLTILSTHRSTKKRYLDYINKYFIFIVNFLLLSLVQWLTTWMKMSSFHSF
jgi:hypothetical protein